MMPLHARVEDATRVVVNEVRFAARGPGLPYLPKTNPWLFSLGSVAVQQVTSFIVALRKV